MGFTGLELEAAPTGITGGLGHGVGGGRSGNDSRVNTRVEENSRGP